MDSIKVINQRSELKLQAKDYEIKTAKEVMAVKDTLLSFQGKESENLKTELKRERKWKGFWKASTQVIGGASLIFFGYKEIKN